MNKNILPDVIEYIESKEIKPAINKTIDHRMYTTYNDIGIRNLIGKNTKSTVYHLVLH